MEASFPSNPSRDPAPHSRTPCADVVLLRQDCLGDYVVSPDESDGRVNSPHWLPQAAVIVSNSDDKLRIIVVLESAGAMTAAAKLTRDQGSSAPISEPRVTHRLLPAR